MFISKQQHTDNLAFIAKLLENKPVTTDLFRQILEFNSKNLVNVKVVFPERCVPDIEFFDERMSHGLVTEQSRISDSELDSINRSNAKGVYYGND